MEDAGPDHCFVVVLHFFEICDAICERFVRNLLEHFSCLLCNLLDPNEAYFVHGSGSTFLR